MAAALREAIAAVVRERLPSATQAGRVGGLLVSFDWIDVSDAAGEHLVVDGRDPKVAARTLIRALNQVGR